MMNMETLFYGLTILIIILAIVVLLYGYKYRTISKKSWYVILTAAILIIILIITLLFIQIFPELKEQILTHWQFLLALFLLLGALFTLGIGLKNRQQMVQMAWLFITLLMTSLLTFANYFSSIIPQNAIYIWIFFLVLGLFILILTIVFGLNLKKLPDSIPRTLDSGQNIKITCAYCGTSLNIPVTNSAGVFVCNGCGKTGVIKR